MSHISVAWMLIRPYLTALHFTSSDTAAMKHQHNAAISLICCRNLTRWEGALGGHTHPSASVIKTFEKSN